MHARPFLGRNNQNQQAAQRPFFGRNNQNQQAALGAPRHQNNNNNRNRKDDFTIIVKDRRYVCKKQAVTSSEVINDFIKNNPTEKQYTFEFDGQIDKFDMICDYFNFTPIHFTKKDIDTIRPIAEILKITPILVKINNYTDSLDETVNQTSPVEEVFTMLYQIESLTVDHVKNSIIKSIWCQSEERVKEFASFLLQVVRSGYKLQPYLIELLISLDESSNGKNKLNVLKPFIIKQMMNYFHVNSFYTSFTYKLVQKGIISIEKVMQKVLVLQQGNVVDTRANKKEGFNSSKTEIKNREQIKQNDPKCFCIYAWFLPELIEHKLIDLSILPLSSNIRKFASNYYYDKKNLSIYKRMRDSMEPENEIIKAIFNDDVDTLQEFVSKGNVNIDEFKVQSFDFLEIFQAENPKKLIDYSVAYGSIKCFKYLLLNHATVDQQTLGYAIFGGNTEIIRTIDQKSEEENLSYVNIDNNNNNNHLRNFGAKSKDKPLKQMVYYFDDENLYPTN